MEHTISFTSIVHPQHWHGMSSSSWAAHLVSRIDLPTELYLIASALFPIYTGAHASLCRPPSAAQPDSKRRKKDGAESADESDDEPADEGASQLSGLTPADAIVLPLVAGAVLAAMYLVIQWLQDAALLNLVLNVYFAGFSVFAVARLVADGLAVVHSLVFPRRYALDGALYRVSRAERRAAPVAVAVAVAGDKKTKRPALPSPLPGRLARVPLPARALDWLWAARELPSKKWTAHIRLRGSSALKLRLHPYLVVGMACGVLSVGYFNLTARVWWLMNLMGFGFSYGALQLMSPTSFATGALVLLALLCYDIYMVFFTYVCVFWIWHAVDAGSPMMITVATSLEIPAKLVFPRPSEDDSVKYSMLGLGDIVIPGIMIAFALRFDLYRFYQARQTQPAPDSTRKRTPAQVKKARYMSLSGRWGDYWWSCRLLGSPAFSRAPASKQDSHFTFPKPYFHAGLAGYTLGMLATLVALRVSEHGQPALLYLVPGVLGVLLLTALVRGELREMWNFSEVENDEVDSSSAKEKPGSGSGSGSGSSAKPAGLLSNSGLFKQAERIDGYLQKHIHATEEPSTGRGESPAKRLKVR